MFNSIYFYHTYPLNIHAIQPLNNLDEPFRKTTKLSFSLYFSSAGNLAVHYKLPDPAEPSEEGHQFSTNSARQRREIPLACRGASGRIKRSCVIIPPPPPKPTTPSKIREGTIPANVDFQGNIFNPNTTERYLLRVFSSNCIFWNETTESWINQGCKVSTLCILYSFALFVVRVVLVLD